MYAPFFGLQHAPFSIAPDPRYLFMSERHREALAHLLYGLDAGGGFVLLTGDIGTGKTTVCRCFLEQIPAHCNVAYIFNPKLTVNELLRSICDEFGVAHVPAVPGMETAKDCIDPLNAFLLEAHAQGRSNVLVIDEAQNLAPEVLEQLRLLTNLETSERKLLQIILIGQPELRDMVADPSLEQLAQRVIARFHLGALSQEETKQYISHRLQVAGLRGPAPFSRRAVERVHALARGVPRRINLLCDRALLGAYASGSQMVSERIVQRAAQEVFAQPKTTRAAATSAAVRRWGLAAAAGVVVGAAAMAGVHWFAGGDRSLGRDDATQGAQAGGAAPAQAPASSASRPASAASSAGAATPAASAPASAGSAAAGKQPAPSAALQQLINQPKLDEAADWRALAQAWGSDVALGAQPCASLAGAGLRCYRTRRASLELLAQLDRPALLTLRPSHGGETGAGTSDGDEAADGVTAVLLRLDGGYATLSGAGKTLRVPVSELAQVWHGDMATLWRTPPGLPDSGGVTDAPATLAWLDRQLVSKAAGGTGDLRERMTPEQRRDSIQRFQRAQGLEPDGRAGPLTLMQLNRAVGVTEPRLRDGA
ncbi:MAG: AAA family ATPase [Comamonadaceae bacterium]|nr:MAG: AAA family ATPase [Comamonadaceae bacterium]